MWHVFVYLVSVKQILKFHERVISALILVASFARPKTSSQLLRVSGILKFVGSQLRGRHEKSVPLSPFLNPPVCLQLRDEARVKPLAR